MGRPPKNQDKNNFNADDLLNEIEALKIENEKLNQVIKDQDLQIADLNNIIMQRNSEIRNTPRPTVSGIKITVDHSVHYNMNTYLPGQVIQNPQESDINELLKFGELI